MLASSPSELAASCLAVCVFGKINAFSVVRVAQRFEDSLSNFKLLLCCGCSSFCQHEFRAGRVVGGLGGVAQAVGAISLD
jgi:hypothetical protein